MKKIRHIRPRNDIVFSNKYNDFTFCDTGLCYFLIDVANEILEDNPDCSDDKLIKIIEDRLKTVDSFREIPELQNIDIKYFLDLEEVV